MDARPLIEELARRFVEAGLEAVLLGNAGAALQGVPVTTVDFDFLIRKSPQNSRKIKAVARALDAELFRPFYPASNLIRLMRDDGLQVDFMTDVHGLRSFEGVKARSARVDLGGPVLLVASLDDIVRSKKATDRLKDQAALPILEKALERQKAKPKEGTSGDQERE